jgi:ankyrin repeat protein
MAAVGLASAKFDATAATASASAELTHRLLMAAANINSKTHRILGTALHIAVFRNQLGIVSELLANGANPNARNSIGESPLWNAVIKAERIDVLKLLLDNGADPNARDSRGNRLFLLAVSVGCVEGMERLIACGADLTAGNPGGWTATTLAEKRKDPRTLQFIRSQLTH